ncbi:hypothetical protein SAMN02746041_00979 [Desulfacinum hydrothermale DSM 13146]|uniref:Uncharacterized protein n=2 Tax=Desulfacinum hydrothermale TaxID=109258 RepID=A0A1W1X9X3_9BACT|nr:hypothetical protein SAMN02746041_00979 [Desulfacinum hydrothermale DSM 13146]
MCAFCIHVNSQGTKLVLTLFSFRGKWNFPLGLLTAPGREGENEMAKRRDSFTAKKKVAILKGYRLEGKRRSLWADVLGTPIPC